MKGFTASLVLVCSFAFILLFAACVQSGAVTQFTLQETQIVGGGSTQGQVTVQVMPANFRCQNFACPVLVESSNPAVATVQGGLDVGIGNARVVFANGPSATFTVTTKPVTSTTDVTFTTSFLVCLQKQGPVSIKNCQRIGERRQVTLQVAPGTPEGLFTCEDNFAISKPDKPPLSLDGLKPPSDFAELPRNHNYVIGFHFLKTDAALLAQPVQAHCKFTNPEFGAPLGVIWKIDEERQSAAYVVALNLDSVNGAEAKGFLFDEKGTPTSIQFTVTQLKPTESATKALPIDVTIRADAVCFRVDERRYCSSGGAQHELSVKAQFSSLYEELVEAPVGKAVEILKAHDLLKTSDLAFANSVSELEDPERIKNCLPQQPESCHADLIAAATSAQGELPPKTEVQLGVFVVNEDINLIAQEHKLPSLPSGYYVVLANTDDQGQLTLPVTVRGLQVKNGDVGGQIEGEIPAKLPAYLNPEQGIVEIYNIEIYFCLVWEYCD